MKVAVTGVSGYLGQLVTSLLDTDPAVESILGLDIAASEFNSPKFTYKKADVRSADFEKILKNVDVVHHLAFIVEPPRGMPMATIDEINIRGSRRVFEGAVAAGVKKIVYASSIASYGAHHDNPSPLTEEHPLRPNPDWFYSRAKGEVEVLLDELQAKYPEMIVIRFRPPTFLGPTIKNPAGKMFLQRRLLCLGDVKLDICWDEDVAEAFRLALHYNESDSFNLSGEKPITMEEAGELLGKKLIKLKAGWVSPFVKLATRLKILPEGSVDWLDVGIAGSINVSAKKAREKLGWKPRYDSPSALLKFIESVN